jgi:hypothetical protein
VKVGRVITTVLHHSRVAILNTGPHNARSIDVNDMNIIDNVASHCQKSLNVSIVAIILFEVWDPTTDATEQITCKVVPNSICGVR